MKIKNLVGNISLMPRYMSIAFSDSMYEKTDIYNTFVFMERMPKDDKYNIVKRYVHIDGRVVYHMDTTKNNIKYCLMCVRNIMLTHNECTLAVPRFEGVLEYISYIFKDTNITVVIVERQKLVLNCNVNCDMRFSPYHARIIISRTRRNGVVVREKTMTINEIVRSAYKGDHFEWNNKTYPKNMFNDFKEIIWGVYLKQNPELIKLLNKFDYIEGNDALVKALKEKK